VISFSQEVGAQWNKLAASGKAKYEKMSEKDKARAAKENAK
jgi:hypothetical protein